MKAKKRLNLSIPLWWPSGPGWRRLARWLLPSPGNVLFTLLVVGGLLWATSAGALPLRAPTLAGDSTTTISYQGRLADSSGDPVDSPGIGMQFRLYNTDTGGSSLWEEPHTAVPVEDGLFHVLLGSTNPIPVSLLANNSTLWLGITVGSDSEMTPREQIASVPYAMIASTVADGAVTSAKLANDLAVNGDFTAAGSIGIGTTNPEAKLEVKGNGDATLRITDAGDTYDDGDIQSQIVFYGRHASSDSNAYQTGAIRVVNSNPDGTGGTSLVFRTQQSGILTNYNRMVINQYGQVGIAYNNPGAAMLAINGKVGIGTTSPGAKLDVQVANEGDTAAVFGSGAKGAYLRVVADRSAGMTGGLQLDQDAAYNWRLQPQLTGSDTGGKLSISYSGTSGKLTIPNADVGIGTTSPNHPLEMASGAHVTSGGVWTNASDGNLKENFAPVDERGVLKKLAEVPINTWNYQAEKPSIRHMGPIAQDFYAAFGLGEDDKHISTADADGVALAAIQGLYQLVQEQDAQIAAQQRQNAALEARLAALEQLLQELDKR